MAENQTSKSSSGGPTRPSSNLLFADLFRRRNEKATMIEILKQNILFQTLDRRELNYLSTLVYERVYQIDEPIFRQDERGIGMYVIAKGRVAIRTQSPERPGEEVQVTTLSEGSFFGELALVDPENIRSASAIALERTVAIGFFKPDLMELLERKPSMGVKILFQLSAVLGKRLLEANDRIGMLAREATALRGNS